MPRREEAAAGQCSPAGTRRRMLEVVSRELVTSALADLSQPSAGDGRSYDAHLQAHRVDNPCRRGRRARGVGTKDVCPRRSASAQSRGSDTLTGTRLGLATRLLPMEGWLLSLETGPLGAPSLEACGVGLAAVGTQSPRLVQDSWALAHARTQVQVVTQATGSARRGES